MGKKDDDAKQEKYREYQRRYQAKRRAERRAQVDAPPGDNCPPPDPGIETPDLPLRTAQDALDMIREQVNLVRRDRTAGTQNRARTVAYLLSVGLKAIEVVDLAERLTALEAQMKAKP